MDKSLCTSDFLDVNGIRLHYLDWGGDGPMLLFLSGMGCSIHIFNKFAPRFTHRFHVLGLDRRGHGDSDYPETGYDPDTLTEDLRQFLDGLKIDKVILVGHSMAYIELSRFAVLYPERVLKLVFLDAAYDNSLPETKTAYGKNPLPKLIPAWPEEAPDSIEDCIATIRRLYPSLNVIWDEAMDEQTRHGLRITPDGKVVDKMSDTISKAINDTFASYSPEYSKIESPILSFFTLQDGTGFLSSDYITEDQKALVLDYFRTVRQPYSRQYIEQFQQRVPHAKVVVIPHGHHYCFIKHEELVFQEMRTFLLE